MCAMSICEFVYMFLFLCWWVGLVCAECVHDAFKLLKLPL